jgi:HlyD family secretion protein
MIETFDEPKKKRELEANVVEAKDTLERVKLTGERKLAQYAADVESQKSLLELSRKKLERDQKQLVATKIYAPQDGLVVYASAGHWSNESMIEEGAMVRNRQELVKLPDISEMKLTVKIHESHINQVTVGQPAYVVLDAMPDRRFQGTVNRVAPLPDGQSRYGNPNLKVYATEVLINEKLPNVKPGVSARAEIVITNLQNVLTVPIQAVTTRKGQQVVYVADGLGSKPVAVNVGMYNIKFIEVTSGLKDGDRVLLSPPFDTQEKDLSGAVIADGEKVSLTNGVKRALPPGDGKRRGDFEPGKKGGPRTDGARSGGENDLRRKGEGAPGTAKAGENGGSNFFREAVTKQFDKNGDGKLDESEQKAMREMLSTKRRSDVFTNSPTARPTAP